tara:strand:+ start:2712 stop:3485 length:774 start_codon:yes stop_codon:yes gene_type:complete
MFINNFDPVAFEIFSFELRWYSLSYIFGIVLAWIYVKKFIIKDSKYFEYFDNLISYLIIGIIVGGRLGYIIFYNIDYYIKFPLEVFMIWKGGMSFHGGLIGVIISTYIFSKKFKINNFYLLDLIALSAPIGIFLGRISNFLNSELYGRETNFFLSVVFEKIDNVPRHPSQIYEAFFEGIVLFILLNFFFNKYLKKIPGVISGLFLIFYSFFRFIIEFTREPDPQIGLQIMDLTRGQIICILFFIAGLLILKIRYDKK